MTSNTTRGRALIFGCAMAALAVLTAATALLIDVPATMPF